MLKPITIKQFIRGYAIFMLIVLACWTCSTVISSGGEDPGPPVNPKTTKVRQ